MLHEGAAGYPYDSSRGKAALTRDFTRVGTSVTMTYMDAQQTKHVTYKLAYHFVWCPKYRKKILVGKLAAFVEQEIRRLCEANTWTIGALNVQEDHVHLFRESLLRMFHLHRSLTPSRVPPPVEYFNASLK